MRKTIKFIILLSTLAFAGPDEGLIDGRIADGSATLPGPSLADVPAVETEVRARLHEPYLKGLAAGARVEQGGPDFVVRMGLPGSFTRVGARQRAFLYRLGLTSGLVVLEDGSVVAHYNGLAGDYAHYIYARAVDFDGDGLTDFVLNRNTEDSQAVEAYFFRMTPQGPNFAGSTPVFDSNFRAGDEAPRSLESDAYVIKVTSGKNPVYSRDHYHRSGKGGWVVRTSNQPMQLENRQLSGYEPRLLNLSPSARPNQANLQLALGKLQSYQDVASSIDYANPRNPGEAMVVGNPGLRLMELLDTRAAVYAYENATKVKLDHRKTAGYGLKLEGLSDAEQILKAYVERTNASLGGMSPYR